MDRTYFIADRNRGCRLVRNASGAAFELLAPSQEQAEAEALRLGFNCDWETGGFHLIDFDNVARQLLQKDEVHRG